MEFTTGGGQHSSLEVASWPLLSNTTVSGSIIPSTCGSGEADSPDEGDGQSAGRRHRGGSKNKRNVNQRTRALAKLAPSISMMPETSTKRLVEDLDTALRDAYHVLRTVLHKAEDLKMKMIRQPEANPFGPEHDEMYKMYLDLSKRFQEMREEIRGRTIPVQLQPPTPEPVPHFEEPPAEEPSPTIKRRKTQPYVLVPVSFATPPPSDIKDRFSVTAASKFSLQPASHQQERFQSIRTGCRSG